MIEAYEVRQKLALVGMGKLSLNAFEDWLVPNSWNMHKGSSLETVELVSSIHLLLSERDDHLINESGLRNGLLMLIKNGVTLELPEKLYAPAPAIQPFSVVRWSARPSQLVEQFATV
jgi:hypothetical protein